MHKYKFLTANKKWQTHKKKNNKNSRIDTGSMSQENLHRALHTEIVSAIAFSEDGQVFVCFCNFLFFKFLCVFVSNLLWRAYTNTILANKQLQVINFAYNKVYFRHYCFFLSVVR